ncbi:CBS domain-containing protein [Marinospirillum alkaliphilum]|uniref:CBS domain-containing protein n=1 Tax=Marinospirillum alkaliphilum DSM 21637 TaxID=1122209 RepID=A0A1K1VGA0_9GAMM|nr:CBS domain-containing protein [Marinospirillum alkaliphilum]SFX24162.1 CBS domain-containing protein [Marinospirillum alkaliphilum DSM 21637]
MTQHIRVRQAMSHDSFRLLASSSVEEAVTGLLQHKLPGAPVVDERGTLVGFVSEHDLLRQLLDSSYHSSSKSTVHEVMRTDVLSVDPDDSIIELAQTMSQPDKPKVYPVVENGKLVGSITRGLLLKALISNRSEAARV